MKKQKFISPSIEGEQLNALSQKLIETTNELAAANKQLALAEKERNEMLANISHDLRAPITAIRSAVDLLLSSCELSREELLSTVQIINRRTETLENLIQDMYYLFSLESNSLPLQFEAVSAVSFFEEYFYNTIIDSRYDDRDMKLDMADTLDAIIRIDIQKMMRVLDNLFTNAAKYSHSGSSITLKVTANAEHSMLCIQVIDTGIGIPSESLEKIFERTYTVSSSRTPGSPTGSGLGLCIVKTIISQHGGSISCESTPGKGSCFTILLPEHS